MCRGMSITKDRLAGAVGRLLLFAFVVCTAFLSRSFGQFETRSTAQVEGIPSSIAVGDFNGDGKLDMAVADNRFVWIYLGNGNGTFERPLRYTVGVQPCSVAAADLNHDGAIDLVVADRSGGKLYLLTGKGDGSFTSAPFALATEPTFVGFADVNRDKELDLLVVNFNSTAISVFLNLGKGNFARHPIDTHVTNVVSAVASGDFDQDGKIDLAVTEFLGSANDVTILMGNGDGTFRKGASYAVSSEPVSVVAADFRGSGTVDLAVDELLGQIDVLLGKGDGTFQAPAHYPVPFPNQLTAADINGDGEIDLVASVNPIANNMGSGAASVLLGLGDGSFQSPQSYLAGISATAVALGDLNGDRRLDILVGTETSTYGINVLLNTGPVKFSPTTPVSFPAQFIGTESKALETRLTNNGRTALIVSSVSLTGAPFAMSTDCKGSVDPGKTCSITATFKPRLKGFSSGSISIKDSALPKPQVIELVGAGTVVKLAPSQVMFPPQKIGTVSSPAEIVVTNTGDVALNFSPVTISGKDLNDFFQTNTCGLQIGPGASCSISVTFKPNNKGLRVGDVNVNDDGGGLYQVIALSGTGQALESNWFWNRSR
jgi:hypothetical protein